MKWVVEFTVLSLVCSLFSGYAAFAQSATLPFTEDFEGATPLSQSFWTVTGTNDFRTQVTSADGPHGGTFHATMDVSVDGGTFSRNELTLTVDLASASNVVLSFWARGFDEESDGPPPFGFVGGADFDGVAISDDGLKWYEIADLRDPGNLSNSYSQITVNLDQEIFLRSIPVSFNSTFRIRFNQFDN